MCKILAMSGIKTENVEKAWKFVHAASKEMSGHPERDGIGYAAMTAEGKLFGERWLDPKDVFKNRYEPSDEEAALLEAYMGGLARNVEYNRFGDWKPLEATSIILHTRFATTPKGLHNVHPFILAGTALIHNGVIRNPEHRMNMSSCDSEAILTQYVDDNVGTVPENIGLTASTLNGSYACAVLGVDHEGNSYMDIFKNESTGLVAAYIRELEGVVFCTNLKILEDTCKELGYSIGFHFWVRAGHLLRHDQVTGEVTTVVEFDTNFTPPARVMRPAFPSGETKDEEITDAQFEEMYGKYGGRSDM